LSRTLRTRSHCVAREVKYKHTFEGIASKSLEDGTRVTMGLRNEVAPPMEAGTFQLGL